MPNFEVDFSNLTKGEIKQLLALVTKSAKPRKRLSELENGECFQVGRFTFINIYSDIYEGYIAVMRECVFDSSFGDNNNFGESEIFNRLKQDILPEILEYVGESNVFSFDTNLMTLDGLTPYGNLVSRISLPTLDIYRENVDIFDEYKIDEAWWLATPDTAPPHCRPLFVRCVIGDGTLGNYYCVSDLGVRPFCIFNPNMLVNEA